MTALSVMPDAPLITINWLRSVPEVAAIVSDRITTRLPPADGLVRPLLTVQRVGGAQAVRDRLDRARLQIEAWADTEAAASDLAAIARAATLAMRGYRTVAAQVTEVLEDLGPQWLPDPVPTPPTPRFVFQMSVFTHPIP